MSTITPCTSSNRPTASTGRIAFETDTKNVIVYDGTAWRGYGNDGVSVSPISNIYSLDFDGVDDYLNLGSSNTLFNSISAFSISAWIDLDAYGVGFPGICSFKTDQSTGWVLGLSNTTNYEGVWMGSSANFSALTTDDSSLATSLLTGWHHIVVTFDGVSRTTASSFKLYVDGASKALSASGSIGAVANVNKIGVAHTSNTYWDGKLDEVSIFTSELSSQQIGFIYNSGVGGVDLSPLNPLGWWRMGDNDSGTGTTVTDQGSGGNNGTLTNSPTFSTSVPS